MTEKTKTQRTGGRERAGRSSKESKPQVEFTEVGAVWSSETTDVVVSKLTRDGVFTGYTINKYVDTETFQGFTKGVMVPIESVKEFVKLFNGVPDKAPAKAKAKR